MGAWKIVTFFNLIIIIFYKILACDCNLDNIISWEINFVAKLDFEDCDCVECLLSFVKILVTTLSAPPEIILPQQSVALSKLT